MAWDTVQAKRLGAALRRLRTERGLTQEALAFQAGITKNQLQLLEAGRASGRRDESGASNPRMTTLSGLAAVLDVDVWQLLREASI